MTQDQLIETFDDMVRQDRETMISKNKDYANADALSNFKLSASVVGLTPELCCLNQIAIKVSRLGVLFNSDKAPSNESVADNALDLFVYSFLLRAILKEYEPVPMDGAELHDFMKVNKAIDPTYHAEVPGMIKVYIAAPYTIGDQAENVRNAMDAAAELMFAGLVPFNPLLSHFHQIIFPQPFELWMEQDFEWVSVCDCVLRLPGESRGADMEERHADVLGKPVFHSVEDLLDYYKL